MTDREDYIEVIPTNLAVWDERRQLAPSNRPHFARKIDGHNGKTEWVKQSYASRSNAVRACRYEGLRIIVLDTAGNVVRHIEVPELIQVDLP